MNQAGRIVRFLLRAVRNPKLAVQGIRLRRLHQRVAADRRERYILWYRNQELTAQQLVEQRAAADALAFRPLISVVIPTYNTHPQHLRECFDSVIAQTYDHWEICVSDDASTNEETKAVIREYEAKHANIIASFSEVNTHIALSSNKALALASGEFISLLDHDDLLQPNALYETALVLNAHPDADLVYSDEDKLEDDSVHVEPFFKPAWSPDFLDGCNYITHFATMSARILKQVDGFRPGTEGAQDWDLFLRITQVTDKIHHVAKILYTWRKSATSTAQSADSKPYAYINQGKVLRHSVEVQGKNAYVMKSQDQGFWRVQRVVADTPLVSIIIPSKDNFAVMKQCVDSVLESTTYPYFEVVVVDTGSTDPAVETYYAKTGATNSQFSVVRWEGEFNFSGACNLGAASSKGEYLVFLNNDTEVISPDWLQGMLEHAQRPEVGMVGVKLVFEEGEIQHAGVVMSRRDVAFHPFYGQPERLDMFTYIYIMNTRNVSAVTAACAMVSRAKFDEVGGFDPKLRVTYNDVDLCLRMLDAGYLNVYTPWVQLTHYESLSVGRITTSDRDQTEFEAAKSLMLERWQHRLDDPYYNAAFEQHGPGYVLPV